MRYRFSIIIPVYNAEKYLCEAVNSIIKQNYDMNKVQVILINDGSIDNSYSICRKLSQQYSNIVFLNQDNQGVSAARNNGIRHAEGQYLLFLDADDLLKSNVLSSLSAFWDRHENEVDLVAYPLKYMVSRQKFLIRHFRYSRDYTKGTGVYDLREYPDVIQTTVNYCVKNRREKTLLFNEDMKFSEDEEYATRTVMQKGKIGYCAECIYVYRRHDISAIGTYSVSQEVFDKFIKYYRTFFENYGALPYIQNLFLNSLRWRLTDNRLWPKEDEKHEENIQQLKNLLENIDTERIRDYKDMNLFHQLYLCQLKNGTIHYAFEDTFKVYVNDQLFAEEKEIVCWIQKLERRDKKMLVEGIFLTPFFEIVHPEFSIQNGKEKQDVTIYPVDYSYRSDIKMNQFYGFKAEIPAFGRWIKFHVGVNGERFDVRLVMDEKMSNCIFHSGQCAVVRGDKLKSLRKTKVMRLFLFGLNGLHLIYRRFFVK